MDAAKRLALPMGVVLDAHARMLSHLPAKVAATDVAFHLNLPVLSGIPLNEVLALRRNEGESFKSSMMRSVAP